MASPRRVHLGVDGPWWSQRRRPSLGSLWRGGAAAATGIVREKIFGADPRAASVRTGAPLSVVPRAVPTQRSLRTH